MMDRLFQAQSVQRAAVYQYGIIIYKFVCFSVIRDIISPLKFDEPQLCKSAHRTVDEALHCLDTPLLYSYGDIIENDDDQEKGMDDLIKSNDFFASLKQAYINDVEVACNEKDNVLVVYSF